MEKPNLEVGIYRVSHTLRMGNAQFVCESDLVFLDGQPFVVLEWGGPRENQYPSVKLPLDPAYLETTGREGYLNYSGQLEDPRSVQ
jgi:hypothetical protein